tara:strand:+ start:1811 stop:2152 length:342 start_codon:yes stop_codon:yes gene_type:complete
MVVENFAFGIEIVTIVLLFFIMVLLVKNREFERVEFDKAVNALLFGFLFYMMVSVINLLQILHVLYPESLGFFGENVEFYVTSLLTASNLVLLPFFGVCLFVSVMFARDALSD